jgi:peptidoglycan/LPS O-acetylase OafA/YrhL
LPNQLTQPIENELLRRHKATATTVAGLMVASILLAIAAYISKGFLRQQPHNSFLDIALRITILIFGLGSIVLRRTRFSTMRLQDIGSLSGTSGLLRTLEKTTIQVALIGAAISVMGFVATLMTGNDFYTYGATLVAVFVMLYCFPTRSSWRQTLKQFASAPVDSTSPAQAE